MKRPRGVASAKETLRLPPEVHVRYLYTPQQQQVACADMWNKMQSSELRKESEEEEEGEKMFLVWGFDCEWKVD